MRAPQRGVRILDEIALLDNAYDGLGWPVVAPHGSWRLPYRAVSEHEQKTFGTIVSRNRVPPRRLRHLSGWVRLSALADYQ